MQRREEALKLKLEGHTYKAIGKELGVSRQRIQQMIAPPKEIRNYVVKRDHDTCHECSIWVGKSGHVHHIGSTTVEDFNDLDNLVLLCLSCHRHIHLGTPQSTPRDFSYPNGIRILPHLRTIRLDHRMTQQELANHSGVSRETIAKMENGHSAQVRTIKALAEALGVKPAELIE